ncbi:MAG: carbohydrate kinase family protein [Methylobacter sp.]
MTNKPVIVFGEVLFDHFPDGSRVLGGAPFNVAWHLQAFQQQPHFVSRVGEDTTGAAISEAMQHWAMDMTGLQRDHSHPTGSVKVSIEEGEPDYEILPEQAYDYIDAAALAAPKDSGLLYHGTLALRHPSAAGALAQLKARHQGRVFIDVNLRQPWWHKAPVLDWVSQAHWVKLNQHELAALYPISGELDADMCAFRARYGLDGLIVTRGKQGACAIDRNETVFNVTPEAIAHVVDTVGAGDAFSSVLLLGLNLGWPLPLTLERAQDFASALVGQRGATVSDSGFYQAFIKAWAL